MTENVLMLTIFGMSNISVKVLGLHSLLRARLRIGKVCQINSVAFTKARAGKSESERIVRGFYDPDALLISTDGRAKLVRYFGGGRVNSATTRGNYMNRIKTY